ncbi:MAG: pyridoxamine 5'-phosphate oxidase family protein [Candidatus Omnitrophica bacterium]|nr:pyridoxamine 5'-phosphate oxidase family protein [Candidatus Omnitrophota bacterium]
MQRLSEEIIHFFRKQGFVIVCTIDAQGMPHASCKDIIRISRDGRVYLLDLYMRKTFENLKNNPHITVVAVDEASFTGYSLQGKGKIMRLERAKKTVNRLWLKKLSARITSRILQNLREQKSNSHHFESLLPQPQYMIVVDVERVVDLTPAHLRPK